MNVVFPTPVCPNRSIFIAFSCRLCRFTFRVASEFLLSFFAAMFFEKNRTQTFLSIRIFIKVFQNNEYLLKRCYVYVCCLLLIENVFREKFLPSRKCVISANIQSKTETNAVIYDALHIHKKNHEKNRRKCWPFPTSMLPRHR